MAGNCLDIQQVLELGSALLPESERSARRDHVSSCEDCRRLLLKVLEASQDTVRPGSRDTLVRDQPEASWKRPDRIGRYQLQEELGAGGMGRVFAALDPQLDRRIALKVVRAELTAADPAFSARLLREARSVARLAHPNVVAVHDSGTEGGEVFVAMELVTGADAATWLAGGPRSEREILEVFLQAGRGLAAAHRAGLIHRDFKPANVLVGDDGRVRVTDFGLATGLGKEPDEGERPEPSTAPPGPQELLTRTGALVGTPAYIAPELYGGARATALSDQFSFCVSLYEALHDHRPFEIELLRAAASPDSSTAPAPPGRGKLSPWLARILAQGLQIDPEQRHPSMASLLLALEHTPRRRRRRRRIATALFATLALTLATLAGVRNYRAGLCRGGEAELARTWNPARRGELEQVFASEGSAYAAGIGKRVLARLERYAGEWKTGHRLACEATRIDGAQSDQLLTLRMTCLRRRQRALEVTLGRIGQGGEGWLAAAEPSLLRLPSLAHCADADRLLAAMPLPADPEQRAAVDTLYDDLAGARALIGAGAYEAALPEAEALVARARSLNFEPALADALFLFGNALEKNSRYEEAASVLEDAALRFQATGDDPGAARASTLRVGMLIEQDRFAKAEEALPYARAAVMRLGEVTVEQARLASLEGNLRVKQGDFQKALASHQRATELARAVEAPPLTRTEFEQNMGNTLERMGRPEEAVALFQEVVTSLDAELGADHPRLALARASLGRALHANGNNAEAREQLEAALAIYERTGGDKGRGAIIALNALANLAFGDREMKEAAALYERILVIVRETHGPRHSLVADMIHNLAGVQRADRHYDEALAGYAACREIYVELHGEDHVSLASVYSNIGATHEARGTLDEAVTAYEKSLEIRERSYGPDSPRLLPALVGLSDTLQKQKKLEESLPFSRRAISILETSRGKDHADLIFPLHSLGSAYGRMGRYPESIAALGRALALSEIALGPDHSRHIYQLQAMGEAFLRLGQPARALPLAERAARLALKAPAGFEQTVLADAEFVLARALWPHKARRPEARKLVEHAAGRYQKLGETRNEEFLKIQRWLAGH